MDCVVLVASQPTLLMLKPLCETTGLLLLLQGASFTEATVQVSSKQGHCTGGRCHNPKKTTLQAYLAGQKIWNTSSSLPHTPLCACAGAKSMGQAISLTRLLQQTGLL